MTTATMTKTRRGRKPENNAEIRVRLNAKTKDKAARVFKRHGLSTSDGIRRLIDRVAKDEYPWLAHELSSHTPNAETEEAIMDSLSGRNLETISIDDLRKQWNEA